MVAMATHSNITVPQKYTAKYKNVGYGWDTSHPITISKKFIIVIYHYLHAVTAQRSTWRAPSILDACLTCQCGCRGSRLYACETSDLNSQAGLFPPKCRISSRIRAP